ncbi:MAG: GNAT family N-acetyltransferase [Treponema sp.]|nr:GNAT family N-acetyltransferase [Treponema sp.]
MENIKEIFDNDLIEFNNIVQEYLPGTTKDELYEIYHKKNSVFVGYYLEEKLIGVCFGDIRDNMYFSLIGIAIIHPYNKQGRGSKLIQYFEKIVKTKKYNKISVGSADGYVEHFYIKNNYKLSSLKILTNNEEWEKRHNDLFPVSNVEKQGEYTKLVIENIIYEKPDKQEICKYYGGCDCFYVFEKNIFPICDCQNLI